LAQPQELDVHHGFVLAATTDGFRVAPATLGYGENFGCGEAGDRLFSAGGLHLDLPAHRRLQFKRSVTHRATQRKIAV